MNRVVLKPGKDKPLRQQHPWIFSGAIHSLPDFVDGDLLLVYSSSGDLLGTGYFNRESSLIGRMVSFDDTPPLDAIKRNLSEALQLRRALINTKETNAYRVVNAEGDRIPGLIVDRYAEGIVLQISTLGMDRLRDPLLQMLEELLKPQWVYEKSQLPARKEEGLSDVAMPHRGKCDSLKEVLENGLKFMVDLQRGQKTGFFLDHREMRQLIRRHSSEKRVLNCFAYTGGFSVYALAGGAKRVDSVEISSAALELTGKNIMLNGFDEKTQGYYQEDVFDFLRERALDYDIVILDPPAFAKRQKDVIQACRGYKDINRLAMQKMPSKSLLLTSSCSYHVDAALFQKVVFQASLEAGRLVKIIGRHQLAVDHPINICHPEADYLKSLLLYVE